MDMLDPAGSAGTTFTSSILIAFFYAELSIRQFFLRMKLPYQ